MKTKRISSLVLLLVLTGCVRKVVTAPVAAYKFAYCDKQDEKGRCEHWATPCGRLHCGK